MPIIGRLMTTSIRLPIHIEAIMPQNRSGFLVMTSGPGWMPWMIMAPTISAMTGVGRDAERQHGDERGLRRGVVGRFGRRHAFDRALAEFARGLGDLLLQGIGREGAERRAAARQHAEDRAERRAAHDRRDQARRISSRVGQSEPTLIAPDRDIRRSRLTTISAMPNRPMAIGAKSMPSLSSGTSKVKRCAPVLTSVPTRPNSRPRNTMAIALSTEPLASTTAATRPSAISEQ